MFVPSSGPFSFGPGGHPVAEADVAPEKGWQSLAGVSKCPLDFFISGVSCLSSRAVSMSAVQHESCWLLSSLQFAITDWMESNLELDSTASDSIVAELAGDCPGSCSSFWAVEAHSGQSSAMLLIALKPRPGSALIGQMLELLMHKVGAVAVDGACSIMRFDPGSCQVQLSSC